MFTFWRSKYFDIYMSWSCTQKIYFEAELIKTFYNCRTVQMELTAGNRQPCLVGIHSSLLKLHEKDDIELIQEQLLIQYLNLY